MRFLRHLPLLSLGLMSVDGADGCDACQPTPPKPVDTSAAYTIQVHGVRLADDDGSNAATITRAQFQATLDKATEIYKRSGANLTFVVAPESDFTGHVKSTLLNHDCKPLTNAPEQFTDAGRDPNTICDRQIVADARNAFALKTPARLVIFLRYGADAAVFANGHWTIDFRKASGGYSSRSGHFVAGVGWNPGSTFYAHEMGHYLHLAHPFTGNAPVSLAEAQQQTHDYVAAHLGEGGFDPVRDGLTLYDGDLGDDVRDTPPDPRGALFTAVWGDACDPVHGRVDIEISVGNVPYKLVAAPDRKNVMSYFKGCPFDMHISANQKTRVLRALQQLNRVRLVHPELDGCYASHGITGGPADPVDAVAYRLDVIATCLETLKAPAATAQSTTRPVADVPATRAFEACDVGAD